MQLNLAFFQQAFVRGRAHYFGPDVENNVIGFEMKAVQKGQGMALVVNSTGEHTRYAAFQRPVRIGVPAMEDGAQYLSFGIEERLGGNGYFVSVTGEYMTREGRTRKVELQRFNPRIGAGAEQVARLTAVH